MNLIDKILEEWAYRVHDGMPNPKNPMHLIHLEETLDELKFPRKAKSILLNKLREEKRKVYKSNWPGGKAPEGVKLHKGSKGGIYYFGNPETGEPDKTQDKSEKEGTTEITPEQETVLKSQQKTSELRDKGEAGMGGQSASQGESRYCNRLNEGKTEQERKENDEQWEKNNAGLISSEETSIDQRKNKLRKFDDRIENTKLTPDEKEVLDALGLEEDCKDTGKEKTYTKDGKKIGPVPIYECTMPNEMKNYLAKREVWSKQELARMTNPENQPNVFTNEDGFNGDEEAYLEWMRAAYDGAKATREILEDSRMDTSKPHTTMQSTPEVDEEVRDLLQKKTDKACQVSDSEDCKFYKKQLNDWDDFKDYHDTYTIGVDKNGRTFIVHISNKKGSHLKDPQNNTTPAQRLRMLRDNFPPEVVKTVIDTINTGISDVSNAKASSVRSQTEMNLDDDFVEICESDKMDKYMRTNKNSLDARGGSNSNHRFAKWIRARKPYKKWEDMSTREKLEASQEYCKERLYDKDGNERLQTTGQILDRFKEKPENWNGEWPPTKKEDGSEREFYLNDDGQWIEIKQGLGTQSVGIPYEPFGKIITKVGELTKSQPAEEDSGIGQAKKAKQLEKETVVETHKKVVRSLYDADKNEDGAPFFDPDNPETNDLPNGPNTQGYIETTLNAMHFDKYIDLDDEDDDKMIVQMGINGARPSDIRNCLKELSGFEGELPKDKEEFKKFLKERCRADAKSQRVVIVDAKGNNVELIEDTWRTAGTSQKVASHFGSGMRDCVKGKANQRVDI